MTKAPRLATINTIKGEQFERYRRKIENTSAKFGKIAGIPQATINRYETGYSAAPIKVLIWYADCFDVSMDYLCCRTVKPQGKLCEYKPKVLEKARDMRRFVEMRFSPASPHE